MLIKRYPPRTSHRFHHAPFVTRMYSHRTSPGARIISPTHHAAVSRCIDTLASAFNKVPCTYCFSIEFANASSTYPVRAYIDKSIRDSLRSGGVLVEAGGASGVALWELHHPRGETVTSDKPEAAVGPIKREWKEKIRLAKQKYIGVGQQSPGSTSSQPVIRPHYDLDFLGRNPHLPSVPGAISAVVVPFLERARKEHLSVWLEATSLDVVPIYKHFGFQVVEEITVGSGRVNDYGETEDGGSGVRAWLMLIDNFREA